MSLFSDQKAQVSIEYLLISVFAIILAITAALVIQVMNDVSNQAISEINTVRANTISNIIKH
jgi:uncharacterized protein (UPF0333 family)